MKINIKESNKTIVYMLKRAFICSLSIIVLGISIAINTKTDLGTDPISVFYNGVSAFTGLELGVATSTINVTLAMIVIIISRKYINIGTVIYAFLLGPSISFGIYIYNLLNIPETFTIRFFVSLAGCFLAFLGLGSFIAIDIGIDPWSASIILLSKKFKSSFGTMMIIVNMIVLIAGYFLGGIVGIMTLFTAAAGGPLIQRISEFLDKIFIKMLKSKEE